MEKNVKKKRYFELRMQLNIEDEKNMKLNPHGVYGWSRLLSIQSEREINSRNRCDWCFEFKIYISEQAETEEKICPKREKK